MADIEELERRIFAALDRIGDELSGLPEAEALAEALRRAAPPPEPAAEPEEDPAERIAELESALENERLVSAQLEERVKALKARQDETIERLRGQIETLRGQSAQTQEASERLRQVNAELRDINARLRERLTEGTAEPQLINKAMMAELDALRATRAADIAEVQAVIHELRPLVAEETE